MIRDIIDRANADPLLLAKCRFIAIVFAIEGDTHRTVIRVHHGQVSVAPDASPDFTLRAHDDAWTDFIQPMPPRGTHDILALLEGDRLTIAGDALALFRNLLFVKLLLEKARNEEVVA